MIIGDFISRTRTGHPPRPLLSHPSSPPAHKLHLLSNSTVAFMHRSIYLFWLLLDVWLLAGFPGSFLVSLAVGMCLLVVL
jgi:hypothetical protein